MKEEERLKLAKEECDCSIRERHIWRQKFRGPPSFAPDGYYCIYCLKEVK